MSMLPFPADSAEYQEYVSVMEAEAREDVANYAPQPEDYAGRCEDAPCCGCCGNDEINSDDYARERIEAEEYEHYMSDDYGRDDEGEIDGNWESYEQEPEDQDLDSQWEDQAEYGMEGCCGDF